MGKTKTLASAMRGLAAVMACLLVLSIAGTGIVEGYRSALDSVLGTTSYVTRTDEDGVRFQSDYATIEDMAAAAKDIAIREGEEGTVVMKNDNGALPLAEGPMSLCSAWPPMRRTPTPSAIFARGTTTRSSSWTR